jgi:hypothetical protein
MIPLLSIQITLAILQNGQFPWRLLARVAKCFFIIAQVYNILPFLQAKHGAGQNLENVVYIQYL